MLLGNFNQFNANPGRSVGGPFDPSYWIKGGSIVNYMVGEAYVIGETSKTSIYNGYLNPYGYSLPIKDGGLGSTFSLEGLGTSTYSIAGGLNAISALNGVGTISNANAYLLVSIASTILNQSSLTGDINATVNLTALTEGYGNISSNIKALINIIAEINSNSSLTSNISGAINLNSSLNGVGIINSALANLLAILQSTINGTSTLNNNNVILALQAASDIVGSGNITSLVTALGNLISNISGNGNLTPANIKALATLSANITPFTELSPEGLAAAVWNSLAAEFNNAGTMGNAVNSAGSAGDPWITTLPGTYTDQQAGAMLNKILKISKYLQVQ